MTITRIAGIAFSRRAFMSVSAGLALAPLLAEQAAEAKPLPRPEALRGRWGQQGNGRFVNPIMPADYSDIDAIRVGSDYYAISSTLHTSPGMVVMHSHGLVNWEVMGHAIPDISPLGSALTWREMDGYARGVWAGALRFHAGLFYIYFTSPDSGLYVTTATDPKGPWSPLKCLWQTAGYDDPCPFWDDDGQTYLVMTRFTADPVTQLKYYIHLYRLSADGLDIDLDSATILHRSAGSEASKLYKFNNTYYHYFSEVKAEGRVPMMKRSKSLDGPWEQRQLGHVNKAIDKEPNQGGLLQAPNGDWWFLTHQGSGDWEGRALCLLPVKWEAGWPIIGQPGDDGIGNMVWEAELPVADSQPKPPALSDDFSSTELNPNWEWNHAPRNDKWSLNSTRGALCLAAYPPLRGGFLTVGNVLSQRAWRTALNIVTTKMDLSEMADGQIAGLSHASSKFAYLAVMQTGNSRQLVFKSDTGERSRTGPAVVEDAIWLRSRWGLDGKAQFSFSLDGHDYSDFGPQHGLFWGHYRGDRVGLFTFNPLGESGRVYFDHFDYDVAAQDGKPTALRRSKAATAPAPRS